MHLCHICMVKEYANGGATRQEQYFGYSAV